MWILAWFLLLWVIKELGRNEIKLRPFLSVRGGINKSVWVLPLLSGFSLFFFSFLIKEEKITFKPFWVGEAFAGPRESLSNAYCIIFCTAHTVVATLPKGIPDKARDTEKDWSARSPTLCIGEPAFTPSYTLEGHCRIWEHELLYMVSPAAPFPCVFTACLLCLRLHLNWADNLPKDA